MADLSEDHIARRMSGFSLPSQSFFILVFSNGRPVVDEDFGQNQFAYTVRPHALQISGWRTLNDGKPYGNLTVPYWSGRNQAESAKGILLQDFQSSGLAIPEISVHCLS